MHQCFLQKACPGHFSKSFRYTPWRQQGLHLHRTRNQSNCCVYPKEVLLYMWAHKRIFICKIRDWSLETRCVLLLCSISRGGTLTVNSDYDVWVHSQNKLTRHIPIPLSSSSVFLEVLTKTAKTSVHTAKHKIEKSHPLIFNWVPLILQMGKNNPRIDSKEKILHHLL